MNFLRFNRKQIQNLLVFSIFLYPLLFIWQGGDLTDTGFMAVHYQFFFENLEAGQTDSLLFLTDLIGATWLLLFPDLGIIGLKFLTLIVLYANILLVFAILKSISKRKTIIWLGILVGVVFTVKTTSFTFSYDVISWFLLLFTGHLMQQGWSKSKWIYFVTSGLVFGLACLSRLPNIVFLALLPLVLLYKVYYKPRNIKESQLWMALKSFSFFIMGFISLILIFTGVLNLFSLLDVFLSNLISVFGKQDGTGYSLWALLEKYIRDIIMFIPHALIVTSLMLSTSLIYTYSKTTKKQWPWIFFLVLLLLVSYSVYSGFTYMSPFKYLVPAFCLPILLLSLIGKDKFSLATLLFAALALSNLAGTNTGLFLKLGVGFLVLFPLSLLVLTKKKEMNFVSFTLRTKPLVSLGVIVILIFGILLRWGWIYHVDEGLMARFRTTYPIEHSKMKGILTTKENALHIKIMSSSIHQHKTKDETLFIYGHQPLFYYLTENNPPIKTFWLHNNVITIQQLWMSMEESIKSTGKWPLIVDTKESILGEDGEEALEEFLDTYSYSMIEKGSNFEIWKKN